MAKHTKEQQAKARKEQKQCIKHIGIFTSTCSFKAVTTHYTLGHVILIMVPSICYFLTKEIRPTLNRVITLLAVKISCLHSIKVIMIILCRKIMVTLLSKQFCSHLINLS